MRVLVNAVQRSSSKLLTTNLSFYIGKCFDFLHVPVLENWFELGQNTVGNTNHIHMTLENHEIKTSPLTTSYAEEIQHRLKFLESYKEALVIKIHPDNSDCLLASDYLADKYLCYNLSKKDIIDQTFSWIVTNLTRQWVPGDIQKQEIDRFKSSPVIITGEEFQRILFYIYQQTEKVKKLPALKHLYYEDLISIHTSREFCDYLKLPFVDFELQTSSGIEYGTEKRRMIANYTELEKFGRYLVNRYNIEP